MTDDSVQWFSGTTKSGRVEANVGDGIKIYPSPVLRGSGGTVQKESTNALNTYTGCRAGVVTPELRIRYLTPRECFRLMGQSEEAIDKIMATETSKTKLYAMAGNSIVVDILADIFKGIYIDHTFGKRERRPKLEDYI